MTDYYQKYLKYKQKYLELKELYVGGGAKPLPAGQLTTEKVLGYISGTTNQDFVDLDGIIDFLKDKTVFKALIEKSNIYLRKEQVHKAIETFKDTEQYELLTYFIDKNIASIKFFQKIADNKALKKDITEYHKYAIQRDLDALEYIDMSDNVSYRQPLLLYIESDFETLYETGSAKNKFKTIYRLSRINNMSDGIKRQLAAKMTTYAQSNTFNETEVRKFEEYIKTVNTVETPERMRIVGELIQLALSANINRFSTFPLFDNETRYIYRIPQTFFIKEDGTKVILEKVGSKEGFAYLQEQIMGLLVVMEIEQQTLDKVLIKAEREASHSRRVDLRKTSNMFYLDDTEKGKRHDEFEAFLQNKVLEKMDKKKFNKNLTIVY
jgi:hypothetical protein